MWKKILYEDMVKGRIKNCKDYKSLFGENINLTH